MTLIYISILIGFTTIILAVFGIWIFTGFLAILAKFFLRWFGLSVSDLAKGKRGGDAD
jgi:hypothetical protein